MQQALDQSANHGGSSSANGSGSGGNFKAHDVIGLKEAMPGVIGGGFCGHPFDARIDHPPDHHAIGAIRFGGQSIIGNGYVSAVGII